jgi:L-fuconolactonase
VIVDSHQHVWDLAVADYPWLDGTLEPIDRSMGLDDVLPAMHAAGVTGTVMVQAVVGVRTLLHTRADPAWIVGGRADAGLGLLDAAGVPFDYVCGGPDVLAHPPAVGGRCSRAGDPMTFARNSAADRGGWLS